jgi:hypothetical protein
VYATAGSICRLVKDNSRCRKVSSSKSAPTNSRIPGGTSIARKLLPDNDQNELSQVKLSNAVFGNSGSHRTPPGLPIAVCGGASSAFADEDRGDIAVEDLHPTVPPVHRR